MLQQTQGIQRVEEFPAAGQLHQEVDARLASERPHKLNDEGVINLGQDAQLGNEGVLNVLLDDVPLPDTFQGIPHPGVLRSHHFHNAETTTSDNSHELQVLERQLGVLERDTVFEVVQAWPLHHFLEGLFAHLPQLCILRRRDAGAASFSAKQGSLAEVVSQPKRALLPAIYFNEDQAIADDVEVRPLISLREDNFAIFDMLNLQGTRQAL
mmetsp:Transcript_24277/g.43931  ORF Transcript_24277/g.43931 Transcript_24277/m.43931 type:complete len:211 (+) Transcript_24277:773-1405(+)